MTSRRSLLHAALASALVPGFIRHGRTAGVYPFSLGVASGTPQADSVVLWTRILGGAVSDRVDVKWEVARDEVFSHIVASGSEQAESAWGHSVHAEVKGLAPSRWYWYRFTELGGRSPVGRTRTLPARRASEPLQFAIASWQHWEHGHYAAWRHMAEEDVDLVLFLGDYIYESGSRRESSVRKHDDASVAKTLRQYRNRYAQYKSDPALQGMHAAAPWIVVWDDHEVANDYANLHSQSLEANFELRRAQAYQAYWEHMPLPHAMRPRGADMRIYGRYDWGGLARIHAIDDRQYRYVPGCPLPERSASDVVIPAKCPNLLDPKRSLLGANQERWLAEGWSGQHNWNLLAQQTLMAHLYGDNMAKIDGWAGFPAARRRLLRAVEARKQRNVVVLGGDVHANYVADLRLDREDDPSPVIASEFCGTSISSHGIAQSRIDAVLPFNPHLHYARSDQRGYVHFSLTSDSLQATLRVVDNPLDPDSDIHTAAQFVVEDGKAGPQPA